MKLKLQWLRYGRRRTGFQVCLGGLIVGLRWSRRVFNAPAGPFLQVPRRGVQIDARARWR